MCGGDDDDDDDDDVICVMMMMIIIIDKYYKYNTVLATQCWLLYSLIYGTNKLMNTTTNIGGQNGKS